MEKIFIIGAGHGGRINNQYVTAPKKMYDHGQYGIAEEGVINRKVKDRVMVRSRIYGYNVIDITNTELDLDLDVRVAFVNEIAREYGKDNCLYISLHSNAGKGKGFEIWTSKGETKSDYFATLFGEVFMERFSDIPFRKDETDGDLDKESNFYVLKNTHCPAILPEWMFFDQINDWLYMKEVANQNKYADMICEFMRQVIVKNI